MSEVDFTGDTYCIMSPVLSTRLLVQMVNCLITWRQCGASVLAYLATPVHAPWTLL